MDEAQHNGCSNGYPLSSEDEMSCESRQVIILLEQNKLQVY
jgi:hypothetical protein